MHREAGSQSRQRLGRTRGVALTVALAIGTGGCGTASLFVSYDIPESEEVAAAPWPRLADVPETPAPGVYTDAIPDPAVGVALETDLSGAAAEAEARAARISGPVLTEAERRRLGK